MFMCAYYIRYVCQLSNVGEGHNFGIHVHSFFFLFWVGLENNFVSFQNAIFCSNMLLKKCFCIVCRMEVYESK
jgi:hypothetical protein